MSYIIDKEKVHKVMEEQDIETQQELANMLGITKNQLSVMLSTKVSPFKSSFTKLCSVLRVSPIEILSQKSNTKDHKEDTTTDEVEYIDVSKVVANRPFKSVELFAGACGLALGFEKAGFDVQGDRKSVV